MSIRNTSKYTNLVSKLDNPISDKLFFPTFRVKHFTSTLPTEIEMTINDFADSLALPLDPNTRYTFDDVKFTSAQKANNVVEYSALVSYVIWTAV